jgi:hypothetical protein
MIQNAKLTIDVIRECHDIVSVLWRFRIQSRIVIDLVDKSIEEETELQVTDCFHSEIWDSINESLGRM